MGRVHKWPKVPPRMGCAQPQIQGWSGARSAQVSQGLEANESSGAISLTPNPSLLEQQHQLPGHPAWQDTSCGLQGLVQLGQGQELHNKPCPGLPHGRMDQLSPHRS